MIREYRVGHPRATYREALAAALDYRSWHAFELVLITPGEGEQRLTRAKHSVMSGGEKSAAIHLPLFAAANASTTTRPWSPNSSACAPPATPPGHGRDPLRARPGPGPVRPRGRRRLTVPAAERSASDASPQTQPSPPPGCAARVCLGLPLCLLVDRAFPSDWIAFWRLRIRAAGWRGPLVPAWQGLAHAPSFGLLYAVAGAAAGAGVAGARPPSPMVRHGMLKVALAGMVVAGRERARVVADLD